MFFVKLVRKKLIKPKKRDNMEEDRSCNKYECDANHEGLCLYSLAHTCDKRLITEEEYEKMSHNNN